MLQRGCLLLPRWFCAACVPPQREAGPSQHSRTRTWALAGGSWTYRLALCLFVRESTGALLRLSWRHIPKRAGASGLQRGQRKHGKDNARLRGENTHVLESRFSNLIARAERQSYWLVKNSEHVEHLPIVMIFFWHYRRRGTKHYWKEIMFL